LKLDKIKNLEKILNNLYEGAYIVDKSRNLIYWNKAAEDLSGYKASEVAGSYCSNNILQHVDANGKCLCKQGCPLAAVIEDGNKREVEVFLHHKAGHRVPVLVRALPLEDKNGDVIGALEIFSENSERKNILKKIKSLEKLAMLDELTQIPNRRYVENSIKLRFNEYLLNGVNFAIIFLDIDHFKKFNDDYGHDIGDLVLKTVSKTFSNNLRGNDIIARWGGEEFIGVFSEVDEKSLKNIGEKLRILVEKTYIEVEGRKLNVTISSGATLVNSHDSAETLIKRADKLLYKSKINGRNCITLG